jgi:hypothetical protein
MSYVITKGYKLGRAVSFYDLEDAMNNKTLFKVKKEEIVKMCESGEITNAKIQWWQGSPIVRIQSPNIPIEKLVSDNTTLSTNKANQTAKISKTTATQSTSINIDTKLLNARVIGKLSTKPKKNNTSFSAGYDYKYINEQLQLSNQIDYKNIQTVEDLFNTIANDFHAENIEVYRKSAAKSMKLDRKLSSMSKSEICAVQSSIATYIMNMVYDEISQKYIKYFNKSDLNSEYVG